MDFLQGELRLAHPGDAGLGEALGAYCWVGMGPSFFDSASLRLG